MKMRRARSFAALRMTAGKGFSATSSVAKNHAAQIIPEASNVLRIGCRAETLGELKELSLFALLGLDPLFHELNDDPVGAQASLLRQAADLLRRVCRKAHGPANDFVRSGNATIIHQNGDARSSALGAYLPHSGQRFIPFDPRLESARGCSHSRRQMTAIPRDRLPRWARGRASACRDTRPLYRHGWL